MNIECKFKKRLVYTSTEQQLLTVSVALSGNVQWQQINVGPTPFESGSSMYLQADQRNVNRHTIFQESMLVMWSERHRYHLLSTRFRLLHVYLSRSVSSSSSLLVCLFHCLSAWLHVVLNRTLFIFMVMNRLSGSLSHAHF